MIGSCRPRTPYKQLQDFSPRTLPVSVYCASYLEAASSDRLDGNDGQTQYDFHPVVFFLVRAPAWVEFWASTGYCSVLDAGFCVQVGSGWYGRLY